jgi:Ligand-binding domain of nuclear hormone receptor
MRKNCVCNNFSVLFVDAPQLTDPLTIDNLQEKSQLALEEYTRSHSQYSNQPNRTGRILLRLPGLKAVTGSFLEQLFFSRLLSSKTCTFEILLREIFFGTGGTSNAFNSWPYPVQPALPPCQ